MDGGAVLFRIKRSEELGVGHQGSGAFRKLELIMIRCRAPRFGGFGAHAGVNLDMRQGLA
jgi:hypothetical protein